MRIKRLTIVSFITNQVVRSLINTTHGEWKLRAGCKCYDFRSCAPRDRYNVIVPFSPLLGALVWVLGALVLLTVYW
jgi:hypothetical protein